MGEEVEVGVDDRRLDRPPSPDRVAEPRQGPVEDVGEPVGILAGDEVAIGGEPHGFDGG